MDVFPETWSYRGLIRDGRMPGPPHHGIGRGYKAGKEEIAGLIVALERYLERDLEAEAREWRLRVSQVVEGANRVPGLSARCYEPPPGDKPLPAAHIHVDADAYGTDAHGLINALQDGDPIITTFEARAAEGMVVIFPDALRPGDPAIIAARLAEIGNRRG
jgi:L-seryl-tRNA(Ser) seleniumtransferase